MVIKNPTIKLFLYDIQQSLGESEEEIAENRLNFWQRIDKNITEKEVDENYKPQERKEANYLVNLYPDQKKQPFGKDNQSINGWHYAFQLADTYVLVVDCSECKDQQYLKHIQDLITKNYNSEQPTIGKTWLIIGEITNNLSDSQIEEVAKGSYTELQLNSKDQIEFDWQKDKIETEQINRFLGGYLFEAWIPQKAWLSQQKNLPENEQQPSPPPHTLENHHYVVWLFPNSIPETKISENNPSIVKLFCHRHKIVWAYYQSRQLKDILKNIYTEIQQAILNFSTNKNNPKQLKEQLSSNLELYSSFAVTLNDLLLQKRTLEINLDSYKRQLETLKKNDSQSNLESLEIFSQFAQKKYLGQIESDYSSLSAGLTLLENLLKTIEGINQIEQTRTEQNLTYIVGVTGAGLAASSIIVTLISTQIPTPDQPKKTKGYSIETGFMLSGGSLVAIFLILLVIFKRLRSS